MSKYRICEENGKINSELQGIIESERIKEL